MIPFLIEKGSYLGLVLFLVLTGCGMPIPEEVPIVLAGVLSAKGHMEPELAFVACLIGALIGDSVMYAIGYHWGHGLLRDRHWFARIVHAEREQKFEGALEKHAFKVLLLARVMVGVRAPVYIAAGVVRLPFRRFLIYDLVAATLVVATFFSLSYAYGAQIERWIRNAELMLTLVVVVVVAVGGIYFYRRHRRHRRRLAEPEEPVSPLDARHQQSGSPDEAA